MRAVSRICSDLVKIRSENPPGRTDEVSEYTRSFLYGIGIDSLISGNAEGLCNLVTTGASKPRQHLFCGHVYLQRMQGGPIPRSPESLITNLCTGGVLPI
jgi:succinyl-diaminopimelate desuccinylase